MQERKEPCISLFRDLGHAVYTGIRPQPGVDIEFRLEHFHGFSRIIRARLVRPSSAPLAKFDFVTGGSFEMTTLGSDYERLETLGAELTSIAGFVESIAIAGELDGSALMRLIIAGEQVAFKIYARAPDREPFQCWSWFADPSVPGVPYDQPLHVARPVSEVAQTLAVA